MSGCRSFAALPKVCQHCGAAFSCGLSCCWCDEIAIDAATTRELQSRFSDCLCRECLQLAAAGKLPPAEDAAPA